MRAPSCGNRQLSRHDRKMASPITPSRCISELFVFMLAASSFACRRRVMPFFDLYRLLAVYCLNLYGPNDRSLSAVR